MSAPDGPGRFSEDDLRAALRPRADAGAAGSAPLDPHAIIGRARALRSRRRSAVLGAGLAAAVVLGSLGAVQGGIFDGSTDGTGAYAGQPTTDRADEAEAPADSAPDMPTRMPAVPVPGGGPNDSSLPFGTDNPLPGDLYADREPIAGTPCSPQRPEPLEAPTGPASLGPLLDFPPTSAYACVYLVDGAAVATELTGQEGADAARLLSRGGAYTPDTACTSEFGPSLLLVLEGEGRSAVIDAQSYGCGITTNGSATRAAKAQVSQLLESLDPRLRPLA